jgi:hypothetical protein
MVAAAMKAVFVIQAPDQVRAHWQQVTEMLRKQFPTAVPVMEAARDDVLAFLHLTSGALAEGLEHQPARAAQQRDQTPHQCGRHLPQRRRDHPAGGSVAAGAAGGMAARASSLLFRGHHGQAEEHQRSAPRSINRCTHCSCLITTLRSGHGPRDLNHSKGRDLTIQSPAAGM